MLAKNSSQFYDRTRAVSQDQVDLWGHLTLDKHVSYVRLLTGDGRLYFSLSCWSFSFWHQSVFSSSDEMILWFDDSWIRCSVQLQTRHVSAGRFHWTVKPEIKLITKRRYNPTQPYSCLCYFTGTSLRQLSQSCRRTDWSQFWCC